MRCFYFSSAVLFLILVFVSGQSPCPDVFEYKSDGSGIYGVINVRPSGPVSTLQLRVNFTIAARLSSNYAGRLRPVADIPNLLQNYNAGAPLQYRVDFPVTNPLPRITAVTVNGLPICYGPADIPSPNQYVATTSLQHTLFLQGSPGIFQYNPESQPQSHPQPQPQPKPDDFDFFNRYPSDGNTHIITIVDDNKGGWNTITAPNRGPTTVERPVMNQPPSQTQPQPPQYYPEIAIQTPVRQPDPQYYPEVATQPPRVPPSRPVQQPQPPPQQPVSTQECGIVAGGNEKQPLIFNGHSFSRGDWPWLVAIYKRKDGSLTFICSGTLVSDRHVITAAHCMQQRHAYSSMKDIVVKVGVHNLEDWGDDIAVTRTLASAAIHGGYNATSLANDILVLTLERNVAFNNNIRPACLWTGNADLSRIVGASGVVAGWGQSEVAPAGHGEPRVVRIPIASTAACRATKPDFHKLTSANTLCAGDRKGSGPCLGDSGGGLYLLEGGRWRLRGVVSLSLRPDSGEGTCNLNEFIVFTDSAQYLDWIQEIMYST